MELIGIIFALVISFLIIGIITAIHEEGKHSTECDEEDPEELPRVVISQQVPPVFDMFKGKK